MRSENTAKKDAQRCSNGQIFNPFTWNQCHLEDFRVEVETTSLLCLYHEKMAKTQNKCNSINKMLKSRPKNEML